ncbi:unnamed protein product [Schistosoma margrebowiei]|uniref:Uncharacterized protein n=1 Tax=Schistosoma margrebowiei TaxID=48269 RepID=A0A183MBD8_9TREM|nr:unnamed protein product [Schistosoma margrebowiei]
MTIMVIIIVVLIMTIIVMIIKFESIYCFSKREK